MKKTICILLCFCFLVPFLAACSNETEQLGYLLIDGQQTYPETVLVINGENISFDEFRYYYLNCRDEMLKVDEAVFQTEGAEEALKSEVLDLLRMKAAIEAAISEEGIALTSAERRQIRDEIDDTIQLYGGSDAFYENLHASYMSIQYYREMMEFSALRGKLMEKLFGAGGRMKWSDEAFYQYYEENYLAVQVLKLAYRTGDTADNHPAVSAEMDAIREKIAAGEDFWTLIETYGEDDEMEGYPDGYYVTEGEAEETLYEAAKALTAGEISEPVAGADGLYLIRRVALKKERMDENRNSALNGYTDSLGYYHNGAYDDEFEEACRQRAATLTVSYPEIWSKISSSTVF